MQNNEIQNNLDSEILETVILEGIPKLIMRSMFNYYNFLLKSMKFHLNPVDVEKLEMAKFQIENNLPIKKELLFQVAPDYFKMDLSQLKKAEKKRILHERIRFIEVLLYSLNK